MRVTLIRSDVRRSPNVKARRAAACAAWLLLAALCARAQSQRLDAGWQLLTDPSAALRVSDLARAPGWRDVRVGLSWNAQFADLRDYMGVAWYRTGVNAPDLTGGKRALLRFGACDYYAEVFVNGTQVGAHEGGYTPFTFDVTEHLRAGANDVVVRVVDPPMDEGENRAHFPQFLYGEIPHGKQNWYVQTGGLWQPVWLEVRPDLYIQNVRAVANADGSLVVSIVANKPFILPSMPEKGGAPVQLTFRIYDPSGRLEPVTGSAGGKDNYAFMRTYLTDSQRWSLDHPNLYTVKVTLGADEVTERFGFRTFEARDGKFYLNGEPFYMRAALDQDFYPETIYTPPSKEYVRDEMLKGKRMGLNLLRCHIKVCSPEYLEAADEVGMLVWYEIPSWNDG
ncbi:MAG: glycoside hydrolase family 2 protein, partial [Pyrinomonadaceae bacterium]